MSLPAASATADNLDLLSLLTQAPFAGFDVGDADREVALRLEWADKVNQLVTLSSIRVSRSLRDLAFHFTSPILEFMVKLVPASAPIAQRFEGTLMRTTPDATRASPRWSQMFSPFPVDATDAQLHVLISIVEAGLWTVYYFGDGSVESYLQEITDLHNAFPRLRPQGMQSWLLRDFDDRAVHGMFVITHEDAVCRALAYHVRGASSTPHSREYAGRLTTGMVYHLLGGLAEDTVDILRDFTTISEAFDTFRDIWADWPLVLDRLDMRWAAMATCMGGMLDEWGLGSRLLANLQPADFLVQDISAASIHAIAGINAARLAHISSAQAIAEIPTGFDALVHPSDQPGPLPVPADPVVAVSAALPASAPDTAEVPPSVASLEEVTITLNRFFLQPSQAKT